MALGETARLLAELDMQDNLTPKANTAIGSVRRLEGAVGQSAATTGRLGRLSAMAAAPMGVLRTNSERLGGAMGHLRGQIGGLLGAAGFFGLAGAGIGVAEALHHSIDAAVELGATSRRLAGLTGGTVEEMSKLSAGLAHFGVEADQQTRIVGMLEKNLGNLATGGGAKAEKFAKDFGFSVLDASGNAKSAQQIIEDFTDFFNDDAIPASTKAAAGAKLFGRSWQDLLPVLGAGKGALHEASEEAATFGETLTTQDAAALAKMRDATRTWHTALAGLETQIGLAIVPVITDLANAATNFLKDPNNRASIVGFFKQGVQFARDFAGFIKDSVLPTIQSLAGGAKQLWDSIPDPLKDLLVKGFVADRTVKFLFGFSLADVGKDVVGGIIRGIAGNFISRGSSPANPMFVQGTGIGGTGGTGAVGALGGASRLTQAVSVVAIVGAALAVIEAFKDFLGTRDQAQRDLQEKADAAAHQTAQEALGNLKNLNNTLGHQDLWQSLVTNTFGAAQTSEGITNLANAITNNGKVSDVADAIRTLQAAQAVAIQRGWTDAANQIGTDIKTLQSGGPMPVQVYGPIDTRITGDTPVVPGPGFTEWMHSQTQQTDEQKQELARIGAQVQQVPGALAGFLQKWATAHDDAVAAGFKSGTNAIRKEIATRLGITVHTLQQLRSSFRTNLAHELGITTGELQRLRRSTHWDDQALADKLGISVDQLRLLKDAARDTAANTLGIKNKDWTPEITVPVNVHTNFSVSGRSVANATERFWTINRPRVT
jgi:hypothetical protein